MSAIFNVKPGVSLKGNDDYNFFLLRSYFVISCFFIIPMQGAVVTVCNKVCQRCPEIQAVLEQNTQLPQVIIGLTMSYVRHYETMKLQEDRYGDKQVPERSISLLFWEDCAGPSISSLKKGLNIDSKSRLDVFRRLPNGGNYYTPLNDSVRLSPQYTWYYRVTSSMWSLLINRHSTW